MEAIFFTATRESAAGVRSADDLLDEPAAEPLDVSSPGAAIALGNALCGPGAASLEQLRDATCQSFPVWRLSTAAVSTLRAANADALDRIAEVWLEAAGPNEIDADLYELSTCLSDLRNAIEAAESGEEELFVLFEEKAMR